MYNKEGFLRRRRRMYEIMQCIKEGLTTKEIAEELGVTRKTIERDIRFMRDNKDEE